MATVTWTSYGTWTTALSTEMDSLAVDATAISAAIDNSVDLKLFMDVEVYIASVDLSAQTNPAIYLWLIGRSNGTDFEDGDSTTISPRAPDVVVPLAAVNRAQRVLTRMAVTTPDQFKILVQNKAGADLSTGNTVKYNLYGESVA